jgi:hypothetical protein
VDARLADTDGACAIDAQRARSSWFLPLINVCMINGFRLRWLRPRVPSLARETQIDPDLARLIDSWPSLPPTVKRMILAALEEGEPAK